MGESIWKKEISFGRKSKPADVEAPVELPAEQPVVADEPKQSVWKKEVSFSRKPKAPKEPKAAKEPKAPKAPKAPKEPKQSVWKKEVSFSRKKKDDDAVQRLVELATKTVSPDFDVAPSAAPLAPPTELAEAVVASEPVAPAADVHPVEVLSVDEPVAPVAYEPVAAVAPVEPVPVFELPAQPEPVVAPAEPAVAYEPVAAVAPVEPLPVFELPAQPEPVVAPAEPAVAYEPAAVAPVEAAPVFELPAQPEPVVAYEPAPAAPVEAAPVFELPAQPEPVVAYEAAPAPPVEAAPVFELPAQPEPVAPVEPAVAYEPEPTYTQPVVEQPVAEVPHVHAGAVEQWMEPAPEESWLAEPALPPVAEADTQVVVHPPVPAFELPPLPELKQPFWKKELSFGRKSKQKQADASAVQAPVAAPGVHPPVPAAELPPLPDAKVPFWKKEIGGSKKPKAPKEPTAPTAPSEPAGEKVPFWKKEIGGSKQPKAPREKKSLSFSMPSLSLPSFSGGGSSKGGHQVKRLVGLKVGGSQLAAARIANNGAAELLQLARADLEPGVVVAGELRDVDSLATALKAFFTANKLPKKNVRLGIASNRIGVRTFDIAGIDDAKQLENAIQFRAQEALPIPLDEAVLDFQILEERVDDEGNPVKRVLLVVAYRELVDRYVAACKKAGITLSGIDLEAFALLRALSAPRGEEQPSDSALVAVAIGHDRSTFAVSDGRVCEFTRVLEWGGASLNVAIARALDLAPSETEGIKRLVSLSSPDVPQGIAPEHYALALDAVRKQVQSFARELVSSLQFYQNQPGSLNIGEIVITGGTANLSGLGDELQRLIGVRVRVGDPLARLRVTKKIAPDEPVGSLAVAIGLGIED